MSDEMETICDLCSEVTKEAQDDPNEGGMMLCPSCFNDEVSK